MNLHGISAVVWKEIREASKRTLLCGMLFGLVWSFAGLGPLLKVFKTSQLPDYLGNAGNIVNVYAAYIPLVLMLFVGNSMVAAMFSREKSKRTIEPLLCTPLNLKVIWLGKIVAAFCLSYLVLIFTAVVYVVGVNIFLPTAFPSGPSLFQLLVVSPLLAFSIFGLLGYAYLVLVNPFYISLANVIAVMGGLFTLFKTLGKLSVTWKSVIILSAFSILLIFIMAFLTRFLSKERIILTIR